MDPLDTRRGKQGGASGRVKRWVRDAFGLEPETAVVVAELTCTKPGCPPIETAIALLEPGRSPEEHRVHMPVAEISEADIAELARSRARSHPHDHVTEETNA
ncbi:MAG TPA: nitrate reductase [Candidatus Dormibacteraeota bacterium]